MSNLNLEVGTHVQWTSEDADGKYSYKGVVSKVNDENISFQTENGGEFTIMVGDGNVEVIKDSGVVLKTSKKSTKKTSSKKSTKKVETKKVAHTSTTKASKSGSKVEQAMMMYTQNIGTKSRKEIIQMFKDELQMSDAGASTYYQNCKKKSTQS